MRLTGMQLSHGGNRAFFQPATDRVQMPKFEAFPDPLGYYATLSHEETHWTGAKSRLDRDLTGRFKSEAYAAEELVAELGAAFLCADLGLVNEPRPDHAAYVANWLKVLKEDSRAIFTAPRRHSRRRTSFTGCSRQRRQCNRLRERLLICFYGPSRLIARSYRQNADAITYL